MAIQKGQGDIALDCFASLAMTANGQDLWPLVLSAQHGSKFPCTGRHSAPLKHLVIAAGQFEQKPLDLGVVGFLGEGAGAARAFAAQLSLKRLGMPLLARRTAALAGRSALGNLLAQALQILSASRYKSANSAAISETVCDCIASLPL